jgi:hypothetical protein
MRTYGGREVIVTASKSVLVYDEASSKIHEVEPTRIVPGKSRVPVMANLPLPPGPETTVFRVESCLPKTEYIHGTEFNKALRMVKNMRTSVPYGKAPMSWWNKHNGTDFTLPYPSLARFQRATVRSAGVKDGCIYPYHARRDIDLPEQFALTREFGVICGLYLAEGFADDHKGHVCFSNNDIAIQQTAQEWFDSLGISWYMQTSSSHNSKTVVGCSVLLARVLILTFGKGAANKHISPEFVGAPLPFITGLLDGYISGDGSVSDRDIYVASASLSLLHGIQMLAARIGVFGKLSSAVGILKPDSDNGRYLDRHRLSFKSQFARRLCDILTFTHPEKEKKRIDICTTPKHINFDTLADVVLDTVESIEQVDVRSYPKVYDVTLPSTLNFGIANGLMVRDTSETGYIQRKGMKTMESIQTVYDRTVRNSENEIIQYRYGGDNVDGRYIEKVNQPELLLNNKEMEEKFVWMSVEQQQKELGFLLLLRDGIRKAKLTVYEQKLNDEIRLSVVIERLLENMSVSWKKQKSTDPVITYEEWDAAIDSCVKKLERTFVEGKVINKGVYNLVNLLFHLAVTCCSKKIIQELRCTRKQFVSLLNTIATTHNKFNVAPGESVGPLACSSTMEPATQMTLSTFHHTGIASKTNVTLGVPRLQEIVDATQKMKKPSATVFLKHPFNKTMGGAKWAKKLIENKSFDHIKKSIRSLSRNEYMSKSYSDELAQWDREKKIFKLTETQTDNTKKKSANKNKPPVFSHVNNESIDSMRPPSPTATKKRKSKTNFDFVQPESKNEWYTRIVLDKQAMLTLGLDIYSLKRMIQGELKNTAYVYCTDFNTPKCVLVVQWLCLHLLTQNIPSDRIKLFEQQLLSSIEAYLLGAIRLSGIAAIEQANIVNCVTHQITEDGSIVENKEYYLSCSGSDMCNLLRHPLVDSNRTYTNNIHEINDTLGIEAANAAIVNEISLVISFDGTYVDKRHFQIIADSMTRHGSVIAMTRHGIGKIDNGFLCKASFEKSVDVLEDAALYGKHDDLNDPTGNIVFGKMCKLGTGVFDVMVEEDNESQQDNSSVARPTKKRKIQIDDDDIVTTSMFSYGSVPTQYNYNAKRNQDYTPISVTSNYATNKRPPSPTRDCV